MKEKEAIPLNTPSQQNAKSSCLSTTKQFTWKIVKGAFFGGDLFFPDFFKNIYSLSQEPSWTKSKILGTQTVLVACYSALLLVDYNLVVQKAQPLQALIIHSLTSGTIAALNSLDIKGWFDFKELFPADEAIAQNQI